VAPLEVANYISWRSAASCYRLVHHR
jgi:hypothetical protein